MAEFSRALPRIRAAVERDLGLRGLPKRRAVALVVSLLDQTLIRVGNESYVKENGSFGLTTLRNRHAKIEGGRVRFRFKGKSGVRHDASVADKRIARLIGKLQDLPGQRLFQYLDDAGEAHAVASEDVNAYLREAGRGDFTAKDFRTYAATILALEHLAGVSPWPEKRTERRRLVNLCMKEVSGRLGNTPAVCRKSYVHPGVVECFDRGDLRRLLGRSTPEKALGKWLKNQGV
jgi:DNA topoisomerase I